MAWCRARGLTFSGEKDRSFDDRFAMFDALRHGTNRYAKYRMEGELGGRRFLGFVYHYETHSTDSKGRRQTHHHHVSGAIVWSSIPLEPLIIRSENLFDKLAGIVGFDDIDFESAEFSRKFFVKSPNRKWAYDVIHARAMEFLLAQPRFSLQFAGTLAMAWRNGTLKPPEFAQAAAVVNGLLDRLPDYVVQQQRSNSRE